jgi:hypothetical protein
VTLDLFYDWDNTSRQWFASFTNTYYYSEHDFTLIPEIPEKHISVYPNPASEYILFDITNINELAKIEIFDNQGKKVLEQSLPVTGQIFINHLAKGLYLYRINNNGNIYKGKIIVN